VEAANYGYEGEEDQKSL